MKSEVTTNEGMNRRSMMGRISAGAVSAAALSAVAVGGVVASSAPAQAQSVTDVDILNFALNLEYLEAEFYLRAFFGTGLSDADISGTGRLGGVYGGSQVSFKSQAIQAYAQRLASDELTHVRFLRGALGSARVARPQIDFINTFNGLGVAAGLISPGQSFNPFADDVSFLLGAFVFEDVGVTAYAGAARLITNKDYLEAAAGILAVEAYHAGSIRTLLANIGAGVAVNAISAARASLGNGKEQGIVVPGNSYNAVATDTNALAFRRTTSEVLNIVYSGGAAGNFGFFPLRVNGTITA